MKKIIVFASGNGSNFQNVADKLSEQHKIALLICNKQDAFVVQRAERMNIPCMLINKESFYRSEEVLTVLKTINPDLIVLAGFLWLIPENIIDAFSKKIINIHPALLPKYGGKGMYGMHVHRAVAENKETESGISVHYVSKEYDTGDLIFQASCKISSSDTAEIIANKVHKLEYDYFPQIIANLLS